MDDFDIPDASLFLDTSRARIRLQDDRPKGFIIDGVFVPAPLSKEEQEIKDEEVRREKWQKQMEKEIRELGEWTPPMHIVNGRLYCMENGNVKRMDPRMGCVPPGSY